MDSNDLVIGSTGERMEPVPAVAPMQEQAAAQNPQNPPRRRPHDEPAPAGKEAVDAEAASNAESAPHRVDSLA